MTCESLQQEWLALAPAWIREAREGRNANRTGLLDAPMLALCGDVTGLRVLDCGCGEGRFCRMLVARGAAYVLGLDLCLPMIEAAHACRTSHDEYRVADVQDLPLLEDASFDLVISYLNQCDLPDFARNTREIYRLLTNGGRFLVANLHPMRSATAGWCRNSDGDKQHVMLDHYFDESARHWQMMGVAFTNFHRSLSTYVNSYLESGFLIERIVEPTVTRESLEQYPELEDECRVPNFIIYALRKVI